MAEDLQTQDVQDDVQDPQDEPVTFTQAQLDSEADKRTAKALETAKAKWEAEQAALVDKAKSEGARLAKLSADEKAQELQKQRQSELDKREAELNARELTANTKSLLIDKHLPSDLADALVSLGDADAIKQTVELLDKSTEEATSKRVEEQLKTTPPQTGASALDGTEDDPFSKVLSQYKK